MAQIFALSNSGIAPMLESLRTGWIGPAFLFALSIMAVTFVFKKQYREMAITIAVAAVAAVLIYSPGFLFGKDAGLTKVAEDLAGQVTSSAGGSTTQGKPQIVLPYNLYE